MPFKVLVLTIVGSALLGLGAIGLLLPVWPTTPFVIGAAACFSGTPKLQAKLKRMPLFGEHVRNYQNRAGLSRKTVISSLIFLWGMLLLSMLLVHTVWIVLLLLLVGAAVTAHILCMAKPRRRMK